jgi:hypothetical protein
MMSFKGKLLTTTVVPLVIGIGATAASVSMAAQAANPAANPAAVARPATAANPPALSRSAGPPVQLAKGCNPCAAKKGCGPCAAKGCGPCAAKKGCNPCNPCGAKKGCNPCNPCGAGGGSAGSDCVVPRLAAANPCAAKKGCNPCNPCGAKKGCNPCNPCGAKKGCNPCNPCAAKKASNPCNPCAAKGCNPCNPCAASAAAELTGAESTAAYNCLKSAMQSAYAKSGDKTAKAYGTWKRYNKAAFVSDTHGGRYVNNYANRRGAKYGKFEKAGSMPKGTVLAKDSFGAAPNGRLSAGPLFIMEKMGKGFNKASGNWKYSMVMPNGAVFGTTGGKGSNNVKFCYECHIAADVDSMFFLPEEARK